MLLDWSYSMAQFITDEYSEERDTIFYQVPCDTSQITLKRVMVALDSAQQPYSIRKGRELLIATHDSGKVIKAFTEIGGYSTLYLDIAKFKMTDINGDGIQELIIEIHPLEASNTIWIYSMQTDCTFEFVDKLIAQKYSVKDSELVIIKNPVCDDWDDCIRYEYIFGQIDYDKLYKVNHYSLTGTNLVDTNEKHPSIIDERTIDYLTLISQLEELKETIEFRWEKNNIDSMILKLNQAIDEYCENPVPNIGQPAA